MNDLSISLFLIGGTLTRGRANKPMDCARCYTMGLPGPTIFPGDECRIITGTRFIYDGKLFEPIPICNDCFTRFLEESHRLAIEMRDARRADDEGEEWKR